MINLKQFESVGIVGFGGYIPYWRLPVGQVGDLWGVESRLLKRGLGVEQKAVANQDEDSVTMAIEASLIALERAQIDPKKIGAVFVGSESHPYAVKPTGTIVADVLGIGNNYFCADLQFACKAGTAGLQIVAGMIASGMIKYGLVVCVDKAQSRQGDALEYTAGAGAAAFILGNNTLRQAQGERVVAQLINTYSYTSDTPDFWRRAREKYPSHGGRFTGQPGYFAHVQNCLEQYLEKNDKKVTDFDHVIFHMPNAKFPLRVAKKFGITMAQIKAGFLVPKIGNPYAGSSPLGLVSVLEQASAGQDILLVSYGSGAGSDAFWFKTEARLNSELRGKKITDYLQDFQEINYLEYLKKWEVL